jgi:hypothetical protein
MSVDTKKPKGYRKAWRKGFDPDAPPVAEKCTRCDGCGQIANSEDGEPWTAWASLPLHSSLAVVAGIVKPIPCPDCKGTGKP